MPAQNTASDMYKSSPSLEAVGLVLIMSSVGDYQNASNIIHGFKSTDAPALENLSKYHKHQTQLLSTIFSKIEKKLVALVESSFRDEFLSDIFKANRLIHRLERALKGGSLAVWFQFEESQQELAEIQLILASHKTPVWNASNEKKINQHIAAAQIKDATEMQKKIDLLIEKIQSNKLPSKKPFNKFRQSVLPLDELLPGLPRGNDEDYRMFALQLFLSKFKRTFPPNPLYKLMKELNSYVELKLISVEGGRSQFPLELQVVRKPSGNIVTIMLGSKSRAILQDHYYRDPKVKEDKLPILYTTTTVGDTRDEFVVAQQAIAARPDSLKYVQWKNGAAPSTDIYLIEKTAGGDPFILATLLGNSIEFDVVKTLPRADRLIKDVICPPTEQPWITDDGWTAYGMQDLKCDSVHLSDYNHQIFVQGPPEAAPA
ncbi:hypothetical protein DFH08DRAFT_828673 [Mycena albidolilacea]|uniref:Uncharacterized protein n=1 Tax=Mycena albidolilacea TaxID=1033008 RepID=A0AAD7AT87_9AGAR|nr:hypothetical protein DFH08DRAFT_828673 [Mycena albidolilacea]